jgi:hypothetical protein
VTNIFEYPCARAAETAIPSAADFPRPRAAVRVTVDDSVFSAIASTNVKSAFACAHVGSKTHPRGGFSQRLTWSIVLANLMSSPTGLVSARLSLSSLSSSSVCFPLPFSTASSIGSISLPREMGRTLSSSSRTRQSSHDARDRMKRSLKRAVTESWDEVRYRE